MEQPDLEVLSVITQVENKCSSLSVCGVAIAGIEPMKLRRTTLERLECVEADDAPSRCDSATYHPPYPVWECPPHPEVCDESHSRVRYISTIA
jgi:hypothetical protein